MNSLEKYPFIRFLEDRFSDVFADAICDFVKTHPNCISDKLRSIATIDEVTPEELDFKMCWINDKENENLEIEFDIAIAVSLNVEGYSRTITETENVFKWWLVGAKGSLSNKLKDLSIRYVDEYNQKSKPKRPLSSDLVPIINASEYEKYANDILGRYYPEALKNAIAPDMNVLVESMGLKLVHFGITEDASIFGQAYFRNTETDLFSIKNNCYVTKKVPKDTIIIDKRANSLYSLGCEKMTIAHECVHFALHRKAFAFARLYEKGDLRRVQCLVKGGIKDISDTSRTAWMENQANGIAPYLVMPTESFKLKYKETVDGYALRDNGFSLLDKIEEIIHCLSEFYHVTKSAVRKRLVDIGVYEAAGTHNFVDGHYIKPYKMPKEALSNRQTYTISEKDVDDIISANPIVNNAVERGVYQFVENHLVLNSNEFLTKDSFGNQTLTAFARNHMDLCCVPFQIIPKNHERAYDGFYTICFLNKDIPTPYEFELKLPDKIKDLSSEEKMHYIREQLQEEDKIFQSLTNDLKKSFEIVKEWRGATYQEIADALSMDLRNIQRIMKGESGRKIENIVSICLYLKLPYEISQHIIHVAGIGYRNETDRTGYNYLLKYCFAKDMPEIRSIANHLGVLIL